MKEKIFPAEEFWKFLRAHGIVTDRAFLSKLYEAMPRPVVFGKGQEKAVLSKIAAVWGIDNTRIALLSRKGVLVSTPNEEVYNFVDAGNHVLEHWEGRRIRVYILNVQSLSDSTLDALVKHIREYLKTGLLLSEVVTEQELQMIEGRTMSRLAPHFDENTFLEAKKVLSTACNARLEDRFLHVVGRKYGIEELDFKEYLCIRYYTLQGLCRNIFTSASEIRAEGEFTAWVGERNVKYKIARYRGKCLRSINGIKLRDGREVAYALENASEMSSEAFAELLEKLAENSWYIVEVERNGIKLLVNARIPADMYHYYPVRYYLEHHRTNLCVLNLGVRCSEGKLYLASPVDSYEVCAGTSIEAIAQIFAGSSVYDALMAGHWTSRWRYDRTSKLERLWYSLIRPHTIDTFTAFKRLCRFFPEEKVFEMLDFAREEHRKAEERSRQLLSEVLQKHGDRVMCSELRRLKGYIVKGQMRNYFVSEKGEVYTYPEGRYVCIVGAGREFHEMPTSDDVVSRIYLCLNDAKLRHEVNTLEDADEEVVLRVSEEVANEIPGEAR